MLISDRRTVVSALGATALAVAGAVPAWGPAWAQQATWTDDKELPPLPSTVIDTGAEEPGAALFTEKLFGNVAPTPAEQKIGDAIVAASPTSVAPWQVASFFVGVARGEHGEAWRGYTRAWPERWNPVIVNFFKATKTKPSGDLTPWCAAFVNWCFLRGAGAAATQNASSGSFRKWHAQTDTPVPGDVVVFHSARQRASDAGQGHVGFFLSQTSTHVQVLGGNQFEGRPVRHAINIKSIPKQSSALILHSFRKSAG